MGSDFDFKPIISSEKVSEEVPEKPGVYIGYNETEDGELRITYVGESTNLKKRLRRHEKPCTHYSYEVIERGDIKRGNAESVRKTRESELIERFAPELNRP